jgi:DNA repair protein RecN (Recombination protein N)
MLVRLHIQNLAVVADASLDFEAGLTVLSGSTGAGKSLILGAVNLLLGERFGPGAIRAGEQKAVVEGLFSLDGPLPNSTMLAGVDGEHVMLRREIHRNGRSFAFVNDRPCTLKQLQEISQILIEPHGQNEQLRLKAPENHVLYLDKFAGNEPRLAAYRETLERFRETDRELSDLDSRIARAKEKKELIEHRLGEIERARLEPGELKKLGESIRVLEHANEVFEGLNDALNALYEDETSAVSLVSRAKARIARLENLDGRFGEYARELAGAEIAMKEAAAEVRRYLDSLQFEPGDLEKKQTRLAMLLDMERRYGVPLDEILEQSERWKTEIALIEFEDEERAKLVKRRLTALQDVRDSAVALHESRKKAAVELDSKMTKELAGLMMAGARFRSDISLDEDEDSDLIVGKVPVRLRDDGVDRVEFYAQTNPGEPEGLLAEVASSGELSRVALALKEVVSTLRERSLLVLDEVDVGVGADLGEMIADRLHRLAARYQIVCITHMPQIAAKASRHLVAGKTTAKGRTFTHVAEVSGHERIAEIARMLGGREGSQKRLALAREMLQKDKDRLQPRVRP